MAEEIFVCDVCGETFNDRGYIADHMIVYHSQKRIEFGEGEQK